MAKFMVLYRSSTTAREQMTSVTPQEMKAGMDAWMAWATRAGDSIVDFGTPLAYATHVGPGTAAADDIAGYSILQGNSATSVAAVLDGHPHLETPGNSIEILESLTAPGP